MELDALIRAIAPEAVLARGHDDPGGIPIRGLSYAAGTAEPGWLHVCVPGTRADGHDFAGDAVARGAVALVVERELDQPVPQLVVSSSRAALARAANELRGRPSETLKVVGVTGTSGKTTTTFLTHAVLAAAGLRPGLLGTVEARVGGRPAPLERTTPESADLQALLRAMLDAGDRSCAMEVSSHALELHRVDCVRFAAVAFTNLQQDHLDFHGTMEAYYRAKRRLFSPGVPAAVNVDDPAGRRLVGETEGPRVTFGTGPDATVRPARLEIGRGGAIDLVAATPRGELRLDVRLRGRFNVLNVLCAVSLGELLELPHAAVAAGVAAVPGVPGRFEAVDAGQPFAVVVDYAHKPGALENVLQAARGMAEGRVIVVFGAGGDRDRGKRPLMGEVARRLADVAVVTSDNPRSEDPEAIIAEITAGHAMAAEPDRRRAIERALAEAAPGDVVVIAGKGNETGQQFADRTVPFDDRDVAREALRAMGAPAQPAGAAGLGPEAR